jgi:hypothetical protein
MHSHIKAAASWARSGRILAETLGLPALAQTYTKEIVARAAVRQRLEGTHGRNWLHRLLRTDGNSRTLEDVAIEMCEVALATGNDYEIRRYQVFCGVVADLIAESRLRGELTRESDGARRIRELRLEMDSQVARERGRLTGCPDALREFAAAQERDAANDLAEASRARIEAELQEGQRTISMSRLDQTAPGAA